MDNGIDYPWIGEMFICIIHGAVFYSWIAEMQNNICSGIEQNESAYPWIAEYIMCEQIIIHR